MERMRRSDERLKVKFVIRWCVAVVHWTVREEGDHVRGAFCCACKGGIRRCSYRCGRVSPSSRRRVYTIWASCQPVDFAINGEGSVHCEI